MTHRKSPLVLPIAILLAPRCQGSFSRATILHHTFNINTQPLVDGTVHLEETILMDIFLLQQQERNKKQQQQQPRQQPRQQQTTTNNNNNNNNNNNVLLNSNIDAVDETAAALLVSSNVLPLFHLQCQCWLHFFVFYFSFLLFDSHYNHPAVLCHSS
jgi:hypothetical protein